MSDNRQERFPTAEPELSEEALAAEADRLDRELTEALLELPQYHHAKTTVNEIGQKFRKFRFGDWDCNDVTYLKADGEIIDRDLLMKSVLNGERVDETYSLERLTTEGKKVAKEKGLQTEISVDHTEADETKWFLHLGTQTAINKFDELIASIKRSPRIHIVRRQTPE